VQDTDLTRAVVPLLVWNKDFAADGVKTPVGKAGTAFFVEYKSNIYAITASHCLNCVSPDDLFIAIPGDIMKSLPVSNVIDSFYNGTPDIGTEITVIKLPLFEVLIKRFENYSILLSRQILNTPYFKRQLRLLRNGKIKNISTLFGSNFYKHIKKLQEHEIADNVERAYPSEFKILSLKLAEDDFVQSGTVCQLLGFPKYGFDIDYDVSSVKTLLRGVAIKFLGYNRETRDYIFQYETDEDLDGCSGGPVIYNERVIGVAHSVQEREKILKVSPFSKKFMEKLNL